MQNTFTCPVVAADNLGIEHFKTTPNKEEIGQFFTPVSVADFMASFLTVPSKETIRILDPGAGTGVLAAAAVKKLVNKRNETLKLIELDLYEIDMDLKDRLDTSMKHLKSWC